MMCDRQKVIRKWWIIAICLGSFVFSGCATVQDVLQVLQPELDVKNVRITGLNFEAVDLAFDVEAKNLNPLPVKLTGFDYDLKINNASFLKGQQEDSVMIAAMDRTVFQIPVRLNYKDLYTTFKTLQAQDNTSYQIAGGVSFNLPALGLTRIPFSTEGEFPAIKVPTIKVQGLRVKKMNLSGADMELKLDIHNPNGFDLLLNNVNYELAVNGTTWAKGAGEQSAQISRKTESSVSIPISLDFAQIGSSAFRILSGNKKLNYHFRGNLDLGSSLPLLKHAKLPIDRSGNLRILR